MKTAHDRQTGSQRGFSLMEILVAMLITMIVMASVFTLLAKGQTSFQREPEVADMQQSVRSGLDMIGRDLSMAGFGDRTPVSFSIVPTDGGGDTPDEIVIIFAVAEVPQVFPGLPSGPIKNAAVVNVDPATFIPERSAADYESSYSDGDFLIGLETGDCDGDGEVAMIPFELTKDPQCTGGGGDDDDDDASDDDDDGGCARVKLSHNPGQSDSGFNRPGGFNDELEPDCAVFGAFRVIQYRINPLPPAANPTLERRDVGAGEDWTPVARNIENLQVQYALGTDDDFFDSPAMPDENNPATWITQVSVRLDGTSESTNLQGSSTGVFADGNRLRKTFTTTVVLRNITSKLALADTDADGKPDYSYN